MGDLTNGEIAGVGHKKIALAVNRNRPDRTKFSEQRCATIAGISRLSVAGYSLVGSALDIQSVDDIRVFLGRIDIPDAIEGQSGEAVGRVQSRAVLVAVGPAGGVDIVMEFSLVSGGPEKHRLVMRKLRALEQNQRFAFLNCDGDRISVARHC